MSKVEQVLKGVDKIGDKCLEIYDFLIEWIERFLEQTIVILGRGEENLYREPLEKLLEEMEAGRVDIEKSKGEAIEEMIEETKDAPDIQSRLIGFACYRLTTIWKENVERDAVYVKACLTSVARLVTLMEYYGERYTSKSKEIKRMVYDLHSFSEELERKIADLEKEDADYFISLVSL